MYKRNILDKLLISLRDSPVVLVTGARQTGKTTLVRQISTHHRYSYTTFDDLFAKAAADADPMSFVEDLEKPAILDEVQGAPKIFLPIKKDVDLNRLPGRYLFTGSANPLVVPNLGDSLAGRMQLVHLWPLSQGELRGIKENFIDRIFGSKFETASGEGSSKNELIRMTLSGGYPDLQGSLSETSRYGWCNGYLTALIQKDITDLAKIENLHSIPNILKILAARSGNVLNERDLARTVGTPVTTTHRYLLLLQNLFLVFLLPGWFRNTEKRVIKAPKVYFVDTAILLHLLGYNETRLQENPAVFGHVLENFLVCEILKQLSWSDTIATIHHFRSHTGSAEVDLVLENSSGKVVGIEIKAKETISADDFKGLAALQQIVGKDFLRGIVLYTGSRTLSFGPNLLAMPISELWKGG